MCITTFPCIPLTNSFELSAFNSRCLSSVFLLRLITHNLLLFPGLPFDSALGDIHPLLHFSYDLRLITYDFLSAFNFYLKTSISIISRVYPSTSLWVTSSSVCISRTTYDLLLTTPFELSAFTSRLLSTTPPCLPLTSTPGSTPRLTSTRSVTTALGDISLLLHFSYDLRLVTCFLRSSVFGLRTPDLLLTTKFHSVSLRAFSVSLCVIKRLLVFMYTYRPNFSLFSSYDLLLTTSFQLSAFTFKLVFRLSPGSTPRLRSG